ncbi:NAD(P)/FAD-dependent oxidoreductase [Polymorphobacter sp. PAMC 29334]|uniref:phytoene desaturase family protein n=1 Tax=Polymorphobacter sp. PAMC 29334 TaxID=2862331 RepID=UPI001C67A6E2|nr:NAD(P)/FAD-dependent oxidoreductase [Polymorphobacter sp. PAMC 29334]QYE36347.1 NAD(P)/FAD-dependent oxidoreductase [Polymorphobacter sp. PAMC 29334]
MDYDVISVGAGHHGLVVAAYMAKAGKKVLVLERNAHIGGGCVTKEVAPGFLFDEHSTAHQVILSNPLIKNDELGLKAKFGLDYIYPAIPFASLFDDGSILPSYFDVEETARAIGEFSPTDADAYRRFSEMAVRIFPMMEGGLFAPAVPLGAMISMMGQSAEGGELLLMSFKSGLDIVSEWFQHEKVRMHFVKLMTENLQTPDEKGTGLGALAMVGAAHVTGLALPRGGSAKLVDALARCIIHYGGTILTSADVDAFVRDTSGRVTGVGTVDGRRFNARGGVVGAIHPHHLRRYFPDVDPGVLDRAERVEMATYSSLAMHFALHEPIRFRDESGLASKALLTELLPSNLETLRRAFDEYRYSRLPDPIPHFGVTQHARHDSSRAPADKSIFSVLTFAPYDIEGHGGDHWDDLREMWTNRVLRDIKPWVTNLDAQNIIASNHYSPRDLERSSSSFVRGDIHGAAPFFHQMNGNRPTPDLAHYRIPGVEGFYLVGPFMHPGAGLTGASRATAMIMMDDMRMDFGKVVAK